MLQSNFKITLITIGEELLLGLTENTHLSYIGDQLRSRGISLTKSLVISDTSKDIEKDFLEAWEESDLVITTGGLGPTVDDLTKESIATALKETLVFDEGIAEQISSYFVQKKKETPENSLKQAYKFKDCEILPNEFGTAPGLYLNKGDKHLVMLPGPPSELRPIFETHVLPLLEECSLLNNKESYIQIRTIGVGESILETKLTPVFSEYENLSVAFCAHNGHVDIRLSFPKMSDDDQLLEAAKKCKTVLGLDFLCFGHDSLEKVVSNLMRRNGGTLAIAEGCTGGMLSSGITDIPGAAKFYLGGLTCYSIQSKIDLLHVPEDMIQQHSSISNEVAIAMASGVAEVFEAEYTLSTTGYSGPKGQENAVTQGVIYIGLHTNQGIWAKKLELEGNRQTIKKRVTLESLDWLRRILLEIPEDNREYLELRKESNEILDSFSS
ncbi:CinA family nicotinamide mononucleotide deamidase-related protein [Puniceicoccaceae bacterium K14]|nr:CinA family nicotinamide mononucleotide deamidase-related protein [Puniceicoccaceae bacterium K14]